MPSPLRILFLFLVFLASGCSQPPEPIRIGLAVNLSGEGGAAGEDIRNGVMLAVSEINDRGGVSGRLIDLIVKDDRNTREGVIEADRALIEEGVIAIIGHTTSENTLTALPFVTSQGVLLFTAFSTTSRLSGKDDLFVRSVPDTRLFGKALGLALTKRGVKNAVFLLDMSNESYCEEYLADTARAFSGHIHPVRIDSRRTIPWKETAKEIKDLDPDAVVLLAEVVTTGIMAQRLRLAGYHGPLYATIWAQAPALSRFGSKAVEGLRIISSVPPLDAPIYLDFNRKMKEKFRASASARSIRAYEAAKILFEAVERCLPEPTPTCLKGVLVGGEFGCCMGKVHLDAFGDTRRPVYEIEIRGGKERLVSELIR